MIKKAKLSIAYNQGTYSYSTTKQLQQQQCSINNVTKKVITLKSITAAEISTMSAATIPKLAAAVSTTNTTVNQYNNNNNGYYHRGSSNNDTRNNANSNKTAAAVTKKSNEYDIRINKNDNNNGSKNNIIINDNISTNCLHLRSQTTTKRRVHIYSMPSAPTTGGCERSPPACRTPYALHLQSGG